jgi:hypothetical protein
VVAGFQMSINGRFWVSTEEAINLVVPLDVFLGMDRAVQVTLACTVTFLPVLFAGIVFAIAFTRTAHADQAFGANIAGAMTGGLAEYSSMLLGFQYLTLVTALFYLLSTVALTGAWTRPGKPIPVRVASSGRGDKTPRRLYTEYPDNVATSTNWRLNSSSVSSKLLIG